LLKNEKKGKLYIVGTPIGNLEDITLRALRVLREVDLIAAEDTRQVRKILNKYDIRNQSISYHEHNEASQSQRIVNELITGKDVALVSDAGTPGISDPGYRLVNLALKKGVEVIPVPGPSALVASLSISGLPTDCFFFAGFLPAKKGERIKKLQEYKNYSSTLVFYEAPHRIVKSLQDILSVLGNRQIVMARELTKMHEEALHGNVDEVISLLKARQVKGEITLLIDGKKIEKIIHIADIDLEDKIKELKKTGLTEKEAMKKVARQLNISKSDVYRELLRVKNLAEKG
jgi:16S rRNA (cytidine1402-2'-O)-methyltransferase